jgi:adenine deaminase
MTSSSLLAVARGDAPADLLFVGGRVVNVFSSEVEEVEVAVAGGIIAGVGLGYEGVTTVDLGGRFLLPGFIDAHVHVESSLATPPEFARAVVPRGTTTVVSDPHEIANVHGLEGIRYMLEASEGLPLTVYVMASSCVPATSMGTAGATLGAEKLEGLLSHPRVLGLAEVMNFPGVIFEDPDVKAKLEAFRGRVVDGHAPGVRGKALNAYVAGGPASDHESTTPQEALEKLRRGLFIFLREATNARNLRDLLPMLSPENRGRVALCTDDRHPPDLLAEGGIDTMLRILIREGTPPIEAIRLATLNPAGHFRLHDRGAIAPGRRADLLVVRDLARLDVERVYAGGREVARDGMALDWSPPPPPVPPRPSMTVAPQEDAFRIAAREGKVRVIEVIPDQIVTGSVRATPTIQGDQVVSDPERDLLKIAVLERHIGSGRIGRGLVKGMGLRCGAIAGTVAHDHHNLIVVGVDDGSMLAAVRAVAEMGGGFAVAHGGDLRATLPLPVAGLMSEDPIEKIRDDLQTVVAAARELGSSLHDPFMAMAFLGLEVIPSLKITDQGLVDVDRFEPVDLWL